MHSAGAAAALAARSLAAANPQGRLPCPLCASGVRGASLEDHLAKVHAGEVLDGRDDFLWLGRSGSAPFWTILVLVLGLAWTLVGLTTHIEIAARTALLGAAVATLALAVLGLSIGGLLPAKMTYDGESLKVVSFLGLRRKVVPLSATLEMGPLWERHGKPSDAELFGWQGENRKGRYLRIRGPDTAITVMARRAPLGEYWRIDEIKGGPRRYWSDIRISSEGFVALEYLLASHGILSLRSESSSGRSRTW